MLLRLLRHPAAASRGKRCIGQTDVPLSAKGLATIEPIVEEDARATPTRILSSDLRRCRVLADAIGARLSICPEHDAIWREVNFGVWKGRTWDDIRSDDPDALAAWMRDFVTVAPPGGESFHQVQFSVVSALRRIDPVQSDNLLVVTHARHSVPSRICHSEGRLNWKYPVAARPAFDGRMTIGELCLMQFPRPIEREVRP